ncbi:MAG TPA: hypothetical protein VME68_03765 [Acidobacteriaceae bacterium]|nr:hypothetical protein [Acidobacteriaceae bacterium]
MNPAIPRRRFLGIAFDERFLDHRRRSSTFATMVGAVISGGLFEYHLIAQHRYDWDLAAVLGGMVITKYAAFAWFRLRA